MLLIASYKLFHIISLERSRKKYDLRRFGETEKVQEIRNPNWAIANFILFNAVLTDDEDENADYDNDDDDDGDGNDAAAMTVAVDVV